MAKSGQRFIKENRAPRVHIEYEVETFGSRQKVELPFVMGVMSDLSGKSLVEKKTLADRDFTEFDMDNFDQRMAAIEPAVAFNAPNKLGEGGDKLSVALKFSKFDDFNPAAIARQIPATAKLLEAREQLANLLRYMDGKMAASDQIKALLADPQLMAALKDRLGKGEPSEDKTAN